MILFLKQGKGDFYDSPESEVMNRYRYNFMGGMLPFGLGILYARYGEKILMTFHSPISMQPS